MNAHKTTCLIVSLILFSCLAGHLPAKETFTLEQVLSPPYPWGLTSAKKANRIAWIFYYQGERNVWTAAAPDFKPVNLTGYAKDQVFELPDVYLTEDGKTAVYIKNGNPNSVGWVTNSDSAPTSIATVSAQSGEITVIAPERLPAEYPQKDLVIPQLVIVKAADGLEIPCQLFIPKDAKPGDNRPGVVYTHGGPIRQMLLGWHYMEFYSEAYGINQYFANQGYVVISINYRSGIGYGRSFRNAANTGMRGSSEYQDVLAGAKYLQSRPEVDPERIGKWGLSYGGLLTAMWISSRRQTWFRSLGQKGTCLSSL